MSLVRSAAIAALYFFLILQAPYSTRYDDGHEEILVLRSWRI